MDPVQMTAWAESPEGQMAIGRAVWTYRLSYSTGLVATGTELAQLRYKIAAVKVDVPVLVAELAPAIAELLPGNIDPADVEAALRAVFADAATPG